MTHYESFTCFLLGQQYVSKEQMRVIEKGNLLEKKRFLKKPNSIQNIFF